MLDNILNRVVAALESIADSLEIIAGKTPTSDGGDVTLVVPAAEPEATTVAQAKEKKPRTSKKKADPAPEPAAEPAPTTQADANTLFSNQPAAQPAAQPAMTLEQCNTVLIDAVNSGVPASNILDILREYAPEANLRFIDSSRYYEIATRVNNLLTHGG